MASIFTNIIVQNGYIAHCDQVNAFPVIKGTPGICHDPIDLLEVRFQTEVGIVYQYLQYVPPFVNEISIC